MTTKDVTHYMNLPYTMVLRVDRDGDYVGKIDELQGCIAHGHTEVEALRRLREAQAIWIQDALDSGELIPVPSGETELPSGKWVQRVARSLHKCLAEDAKREGVSLNQLVATVLAEYLGNKKATRPGVTLNACFLGPDDSMHHLLSAARPEAVWNASSDWQIEGAGSYPMTGVVNKIAGLQHLLEPKQHPETYFLHAAQTKKCFR